MKRIALAVAALLALPDSTAGAQIFPGETPAQIAARMAKLDSVDRARAAAEQDNVNNINNPNHPGGRALRALADSILKASADKHKAEMAAERAAWKRCSKATRIGASERTVTAGCGKPDAVNAAFRADRSAFADAARTRMGTPPSTTMGAPNDRSGSMITLFLVPIGYQRFGSSNWLNSTPANK